MTHPPNAGYPVLGGFPCGNVAQGIYEAISVVAEADALPPTHACRGSLGESYKKAR